MKKRILDFRFWISDFSSKLLSALWHLPSVIRPSSLVFRPSSFVFLLSALCLLPAALCFGGVGTTGAQFLQIAPGARAVAMGEAFVARADDLTALWWNPAGLANLSAKELYLSYYRWFEGINYGFAGYGQPISFTAHRSPLTGSSSVNGQRSTVNVIAGGITTLQATGIQETGETGAEAGEETPFYEILSDGLSVGDYAASLAYARQICPGLNLGLTMKFIYSELADETAYGGGVDLGILYNPSSLSSPLGGEDNASPHPSPLGGEDKGEGGFSFGAVVQNIGPKLRYHAVGDPLPLTVRVGFVRQILSTRINDLSVGLDLNIPRAAYLKIPNKIDTNIKLNLGIEYWFRKLIAARLGYKVNYDTDWLTCGFGISFRGYQLDYAYVPFHTLGDTHRVSFSLRF